MEKPSKGPTFDRFLMRLKDFIIIATAVAALGNWIYRRSESQENRVRNLEERVTNVEGALLRRGK